MDSREAYKILGLEPGSSEQEIRSKYRELLIEYHPDHGGSVQELRQLELARDTALASQTSELQLRDPLIEPYRVGVGESQEKRQKTRETVKRLKKHSISKYRRKRHATFLFGGILGFLLLFYRFVEPIVYDATFGLLIFVYVVPLGLISAGYHVEMKNIETLIDDADEALNDKMTFIRLINDIGIDYINEPTFTHPELVDNIEEWVEMNNQNSSTAFWPFQSLLVPPELEYSELAIEVGIEDFARLLIRKGLEQDLIIEVEELDRGEWLVEYQLNTPDS